MSGPRMPVSAASLAAEALFCSPLQPSHQPNEFQVRDAISRMRRGRDASHRLLQQVASAYGDHPAEAAQRMQWCLDVVFTVLGLAPGEGEVEEW